MREWRIPALPSFNNTILTRALRRDRPSLIWLVPALLLNTLLSFPVGAQTAEAPPSTSPKAAHPARRGASVDDRVKRLAKALDLTDKQQVAVKNILEQRQQEMLRIRTDESIPGNQRIDRLRALQDQTVYRIRAVLNEEQKKKYDPLAVRRIGPSPDQKTVEDWLKATTPK